MFTLWLWIILLNTKRVAYRWWYLLKGPYMIMICDSCWTTKTICYSTVLIKQMKCHTLRWEVSYCVMIFMCILNDYLHECGGWQANTCWLISFLKPSGPHPHRSLCRSCPRNGIVNNLHGGVHYVKWDNVCNHKEMGGLGLIDLEIRSKALLTKWLWRFANKRRNLWKEIVIAKNECNLCALLPKAAITCKCSNTKKIIVSPFYAYW